MDTYLDGPTSSVEVQSTDVPPAKASATDDQHLESLLSYPALEDQRACQPHELKPKSARKHITSISVQAGIIVQEEVSIDTASALAESRSRQCPCWFDFEAPTKDLMESVESIFGLHPVTTEDCFSPDTTDKIEYFDQYLFICFQDLSSPYGDATSTSNVNIVLFSDLLLTFHSESIGSFDQVIRRIKRVKSDSKRKETGVVALPPADWTAYALLDAVTDHFVPCVEQVVGEVENLDDLVLMLGETEESELLRRIGMARRKVTIYKHLLLRKREIVNSLIGHDDIDMIIGKSILVYLRDVLDHVSSMLNKLESARETLASLQNNYHSKISVEIARASNRMNKIMKMSSLVGSIFLWHTLVAGVFAMNINIPFQTSDANANDLSAFWFLLGEMALVSVLAFVLFKWKHWI